MGVFYDQIAEGLYGHRMGMVIVGAGLLFLALITLSGGALITTVVLGVTGLSLMIAGRCVTPDRSIAELDMCLPVVALWPRRRPPHQAAFRADQTVHDARRTCATLLVDLDVHPRVIMRILRHADLSVTMEIYARASSEATTDALRRLGDSLE